MRDTTLNRRVAEMTANQIELDLLSGNFDDSLDKYRREPLASPEAITPILTPIAEPVLTPHQIWERYNTYKASDLKETTKSITMRFWDGCLSSWMGRCAKYQELRQKVADVAPGFTAGRGLEH
jgi:hypothetical protein